MPCKNENEDRSSDVQLAIAINELPPLPALPAHLESIPFLHKSHVYETCKLPHAEAERHAELHSHKRHEWIGDSYLHFLVNRWILRDPQIDTSVGQRIASVLLSNKLFTRLAEGYGWSEKVLVGEKAQKSIHRGKILADCFEAYFGCLSQAVDEGELQQSVIYDYIDKLLTRDVFPDLEQWMQDSKDTRSKKRQLHAEKLDERLKRRKE